MYVLPSYRNAYLCEGMCVCVQLSVKVATRRTQMDFKKKIFYIHTYMYVWLCISGGVGEKPGTTHIHAKAALAHFFSTQFSLLPLSMPSFFSILLCENIFKICFKPTHNRQTHIATQIHTFRHTYTYT